MIYGQPLKSVRCKRQKSHLIDSSAPGDGADAPDVRCLAAAAHECPPPVGKTGRLL